MDERAALLFIDRGSYLQSVCDLLKKTWADGQGYRILLAQNLTEGASAPDLKSGQH